MKRLIVLILMITLIWGCNNSEEHSLTKKQKARHTVDSLENLLVQSLQNGEKLDIKLILYANQAYEYYEADYPGDTICPLYLFKAANNYQNLLGDPRKAIRLYEKIYNKYPRYENRPMMLFYQGNAYSDLQDTTNAINKLKLFIETYPHHAFTDDAEGLIKFMRFSKDEFDEFFGKKEVQELE